LAGWLVLILALNNVVEKESCFWCIDGCLRALIGAPGDTGACYYPPEPGLDKNRRVRKGIGLSGLPASCIFEDLADKKT